LSFLNVFDSTDRRTYVLFYHEQLQLKVGKYTIKSGSSKFYVTKVLTHCTDEIRSLYTQKSEINREKERKYLEYRKAEHEKIHQK